MSFQVSLGTITNVDEAVAWLSYTYLYIRMLVNPMVYGIPYGAREVSMIFFKPCSEKFVYSRCMRAKKLFLGTHCATALHRTRC